MHVLALVTDAFGGQGGIARYNRDFLTALGAVSHIDRITVMPRLAPHPFESLPTKVRQLPPIFGSVSYAIAATLEARRSPKNTALYCGHILMAPLAAAVARLMHMPLWLQVYGVEAWNTPPRRIGWAAEQADLVTSISRYTRHRMSAGWWAGDPARIRVLPPSVDPEFTSGSKPQALVERYGLGGRKVLLTVSRLSAAEKYKGHDRVIEALPRIIALHPEALYLIGGEGDDESRLRGLVANMGLDDHVHFVGGISASRLADHYRVADVFVMPSTGEGFGIVYLEAAASGLHVIGGNADGSLDALREGMLGEAINPTDVSEIAEAVCRAFDAPRRVERNEVEVFALPNFIEQIAALVEDFMDIAQASMDNRSRMTWP